MKILSNMVKRAMRIAQVEKRDGVYISRSLLPANAQKWHDWAVKWGVPNPAAPEEMHVTILYSTVDVKAPLIETTMNIEATPSYGGAGSFAMFGPDEDHLVFAFRSWELFDRNWSLLMEGAVSTWPEYRPHLTLSSDAAGFELSDAALQDVPRWIILGPEVSQDPKKADPADDVTDDEADAEDGDSEMLVVGVAIMECAKKLIDESGDKLSVFDGYDVASVAKGRVSKRLAKRLAASDWAPAELKGLISAKPASVKKKIEKDITISVSQLPEEIAKALKTSDVSKANDEEQIVMGIASVSTVNGELVKDLHGDEVTTQALVEFNRSLISGSRAGKFDHEGDACTEVVAGLVLTEDWQKALGINLGFEPYLVEIHVPDAQDWAEVKKGDWMLSIAGTMWYYEDADANAEV